MTRDEWKQIERDLRDPKVRAAMRARCEEEEHSFDAGLTVTFQLVQICRWCGERH